MQVSHLDGLSQKHALDVAGTHAKRSPNQVASALAEAALMESFFHGSGPRAELVMNVWFGDTGVGFKAPDGHNGDPVVMPGAHWQELIMRADAHRFQWRDSSDKLRGRALARAFGSTEPVSKKGVAPFDALDGQIESSGKNEDQASKDAEMSGQLSKIYARLPAWVASAALAENVDRKTLVEAVVKVAMDFQIETGRRVIGANIHVETSHDIHIHLTHTDVVPEKVLKVTEYKGSYLKKLIAQHRKLAKKALVERGQLKPSTKDKDAERESMYSSGKLVDPEKGREVIVYTKIARPSSSREHLLSMGPGYCSKTTLWEASGRDPAVVAVNARASTYSFKNRVLDKIGTCPASGKKLEPEDIYIDYWLWRRWTREVVSSLPPDTRSRLPAIARESVERYIKFGDSLPNPSLGEAIDKAEYRVFQKLNRFRLTADGKEALPLEKGQRNVEGILKAFSDILKNKENGAIKRGMKKAYKIIFPDKVIESETTEELETKIKQGIQGMMSSAIAGAWTTVWGILAPGQEPKESEPEAMQKEVRLVLSRRITRGVNSALQALTSRGKQVAEVVPMPDLSDLSDLPDLPDLPVEPDELDKDIEVAAGDLKIEATRSALESALRAIQGAMRPELGEMGIEELQAELEKQTAIVRAGLEVATKTLIEGVIGSKLAESSKDPMAAVKDRFQQLKELEKQIQPLMKDLRKNPHNLDLSPDGKRAFSKLVDFVESIPKPVDKTDTPTPKRNVEESKPGEDKSQPPPL